MPCDVGLRKPRGVLCTVNSLSCSLRAPVKIYISLQGSSSWICTYFRSVTVDPRSTAMWYLYYTTIQNLIKHTYIWPCSRCLCKKKNCVLMTMQKRSEPGHYGVPFKDWTEYGPIFKDYLETTKTLLVVLKTRQISFSGKILSTGICHRLWALV